MGSHYVILNDLDIKSHYSNWGKKNCYWQEYETYYTKIVGRCSHSIFFPSYVIFSNCQTFCEIFGKCKHLEHNMNIQTIQIKLIF
jgi:hypothetical protein